MSEPALTNDPASVAPARRPRPTWRELHPGDDPWGESLQIDHWRRASTAQKLRELASLNATARRLALAGLRRRHPAADTAELRRRLADLLLGSDLALAVYGPLVDDTPRS